MKKLIKTIIATLLFISGRLNANDWPQACYNETSMWVTNACKEYIETVYYAAPAPVVGSGVLSLLIVISIFIIIRRVTREHRNQ